MVCYTESLTHSPLESGTYPSVDTAGVEREKVLSDIWKQNADRRITSCFFQHGLLQGVASGELQWGLAPGYGVLLFVSLGKMRTRGARDPVGYNLDETLRAKNARCSLLTGEQASDKPTSIQSPDYVSAEA